MKLNGDIGRLVQSILDSDDQEFIKEQISVCQRIAERENKTHLTYLFKKAAESRTVERKKHYCRRAMDSYASEKHLPYTDLLPDRWMDHPEILTDSLWIFGSRKRDEFHDSSYWGNFVPQIPEQLIKRYSRSGETILDPFMGMGTTVAEAVRAGRKCIGIEISEDTVRRAEERLSAASIDPGMRRLVAGDSATVSGDEIFGSWERKAHLIIMHPPYYDIIKFTRDQRDLSNSGSVQDFIGKLTRVVRNVSDYLPKGRFLCLVIGDKYADQEWIPLGFLAMDAVVKQGFSLKSIVVKNYENTRGKRMQENLWRYRALVGGYYIFRHEYIFIFRKK